MSDGSRIEWTDATWSPVTGCTRVSPGCDHCYIERTPPFRMAGRRFLAVCGRCNGHGSADEGICPECRGKGTWPGDGTGSSTGVQLHPERLDQPLKWRKPRMIFVCSMADLFHDDVPEAYLVEVFARIAVSTRHVFQVLTKRPARMRALFKAERFVEAVAQTAERVWQGPGWHHATSTQWPGWPLPNVWAGVSAENQTWADRRIPILLDTPAAVRWVSAEPLLGPLDLGEHTGYLVPGPGCPCERDEPYCAPTLDWVVAGGESGPNARPVHPDWIRGLRDQCQATGVPFLFKQWGEWAPDGRSDEHGWHANIPRTATDPRRLVIHTAGMTAMHPGNPFNPFERGHPGWAMAMRRVGKKTAGRVLDGRTWDEYPLGGQR